MVQVQVGMNTFLEHNYESHTEKGGNIIEEKMMPRVSSNLPFVLPVTLAGLNEGVFLLLLSSWSQG